jgi:hypothetical protein
MAITVLYLTIQLGQQLVYLNVQYYTVYRLQ